MTDPAHPGETPEQPDGTPPPPTEVPRVTAKDFDVEIVDGRDMAFYLLIHKDGTSDMRATAPPRQVIQWLEQLLEAIKTGEIGPENSPGVAEL